MERDAIACTIQSWASLEFLCMTPRTFLLTEPAQLPRFNAFLSKQELPLNVEVRPHIPRRSNAQNSRLWALHQLAAEHVGCSSEDMHEDMLCQHFGSTEVKMPSGVIKRIPLKRSSQRDKVEFRKFLDFVENFYATELGIFFRELYT